MKHNDGDFKLNVSVDSEHAVLKELNDELLISEDEDGDEYLLEACIKLGMQGKR